MDLDKTIAVGIALWVWGKLLLGLTYYVRRARIFTFVRSPLVLRYQWFARLVSCGQCTSTWTGPLAFAMLWPIVNATVGLPLWSLALLPLTGPMGAGFFDSEERRAFGEPIDRLAKTLTRGPANAGPSTEDV